MKIEIKDYQNGIEIVIPRKLLEFVATNHPENPLVIHDIDGFQSYVIEQLKGNLYDQETGLTALQTLLDQAIIEAATESPESVVEFKDLM